MQVADPQEGYTSHFSSTSTSHDSSSNGSHSNSSTSSGSGTSSTTTETIVEHKGFDLGKFVKGLLGEHDE